jgi:hypothetical protein
MSDKPRNDRFNIDYKHLERELKSVGIDVTQKDEPPENVVFASYIERYHSVLKEGIKDLSEAIDKDIGAKAVRSSLENENKSTTIKRLWEGL